MSARIVLITPARRFIANRFGLGYQVPLGLVYMAGRWWMRATASN